MRSALKREEFTEREKKNLAILETLRRNGPLSKQEISQSIGLNVVTISNYIEELTRKNIVFERALDVSAGGRRPTLFELNSQAGVALGVGLNLFNVVGVVVNLRGQLITCSKLQRSSSSVRDIVKTIFELIKSLLEKMKTQKDKIQGIGIGIGGIVSKPDGIISWPERIGQSYTYATVSLPLKRVLEKEFGYPVIVENDATVACFGEKWLVLEPSIKNLIYLFSGVGSGIIINGQIYTGTTGCAGELSIHSLEEAKDFNCRLGGPCFLKRWEQDLGIIQEAKTWLSCQNKKDSLIWELIKKDINRLNLKIIFQAAREEDSLATELLERAAIRLGIKASFLINFLNPQMVIIGGGFEEAGNGFFDTLRKTVSKWTFPEIYRDVKIIPSSLGENAVAIGAAALVIREVFRKV